MAKKKGKVNKNRNYKKYVEQRSGLQQVADYLLSTLTIIYVFCMLVIYPLYNHNKYYDMGDSKYTFFKYVSLSFLALLLVALVLWVVGYKNQNNYKEMLKKCSYADWAVVAFGVISGLSYLGSQYKDTALWGYTGWYMGIMSQLIFVLTYFFVSRFCNYSPVTIGSAIGTAMMVYMIGILQRFSIDIFNMYEDLGPEYIEKFISTLGQTTWYTSYTMLVLPLGMYFYWRSEKMWIRIVSAIFTALGFAMICTTNSDSAYIAIVVILMVFFWYSLEENELFIRFWQMVLIGLASFRIVGILQTLFPESQIEHVAETEAITEFIVHSPIMLGLLIVVLGINIFAWVVYKKNDDKDSNGKKGVDANNKTKSVTQLKFLRYVMLGGAALTLLTVFLMILLVTNHQLSPDSPLNGVDFFNFVDAWGNHRGFNWRMAWTAFSHASFKDLLIGVGPDCFANAMNTYCAEEVYVYWSGMQLACAHNEYLNMLVTEGLLGVVSYLAIFVLLFLRMGKYASKNKLVVPYMAAIVAYVGHNFFCYQQCITTATIFVLMGIGEYIVRTDNGSQN